MELIFMHTVYYGIGQFIGLCLVLLYFVTKTAIQYIKNYNKWK